MIHLPSNEEAEEISKNLVKNRLLAGTLISKGDAITWKDEMRSEKYYNLRGSNPPEATLGAANQGNER